MTEAAAPDDLLAYDIIQAARKLFVSPKTLRREIAKGVIGTVRIGRLHRIPKSELDRYLAENLTLCHTVRKVPASIGSASPTKAAAELANLLGRRTSAKRNPLKLVAAKPSAA